MVIAAFGIERSEDELRELCDCTIFGTAAVELIRAARALGFANSRKHNLTISDLEDFTDQGYFPIMYVVLSPGSPSPDVHALVVTSVLNADVSVIDPKHGERRLPLSSFNRMWSPMKNLAVIIAR